MLDDNSVLPSYLGIQARGSTTPAGRLNNTSLKVGEVKKLIAPTDQASLSKQFIEYIVAVEVKDGTELPTTVLYSGCQVQNLFGGFADKFEYTLRSDTQTSPTDRVYGIGSKVLVLCLNGDTDNAIILGGLPDVGSQPNQKQTDTSHHCLLEFNGASFGVDKDGQIEIVYRGATNAKNEVVGNKNASGSTIKFDKDGSIQVASPDGKQSIKLDHATHKIQINADSELLTQTNGPTKILSTGVLIGDATEAFVQGTTYRQAEALMLKSLSTALTQVSAALTTVAASLATAAQAVVPPSPGLAAAGTAMALTVPALGTAVAAIEAFEANSLLYLSKKNKHD